MRKRRVVRIMRGCDALRVRRTSDAEETEAVVVNARIGNFGEVKDGRRRGDRKLFELEIGTAQTAEIRDQKLGVYTRNCPITEVENI